MLGVLGLNVVPNARVDPAGTVRTTVSQTTPYTHAAAGFQIGDHLYLGVRQTAKAQSLLSSPDALYPGMDAKYSLFSETLWRPEISLGVQGAFGSKRMAAEYLALSKRYEDFDFTLGLGWGRLGTHGSIEAPLTLSNVFRNRHRALDGETANTPGDWFRGSAGLFGGVQYFIPATHWSIKADLTSDGWKAEKSADPSFDQPPPWTIGLDYQAAPWANGGLAYDGQNRIMARLSLSGLVQNWPFSISHPVPREQLLARGSAQPPELIVQSAQKNDLDLYDVLFDGPRVSAVQDLEPYSPSPEQFGAAARHLANQAGAYPEAITLSPRYMGLKGAALTFNRRDLELALRTSRGSAEEIWQTLLFSPNQSFHLPEESRPLFRHLTLSFHFKNDLSLSEKDSGILYRNSVVADIRKRLSRHILAGTEVGYNVSGNLGKLAGLRGVSLTPVRSDVALFSGQGVTMNRNYVAAFATPLQDIHFAGRLGYLEEMYAGIGGEVLYRPWQKSWAIGLDIAEAFKRDPMTELNLGLMPGPVLTGHISGYYEFPNTGTLLRADIGRYLAGDVGGGLHLTNRFANGLTLDGFVIATNRSDPDILGGRTNTYSGLRLSLPIGNIPYVPNGSTIDTAFAPLGRDTAQQLDNPVGLYEMTEPLSYRHITQHWMTLTSSSP